MSTKASILKVIVAFCDECMGDQHSFVVDCTAKTCPLYEFRLGKDPRPSRKGNSAALQAYKNRTRINDPKEGGIQVHD